MWILISSTRSMKGFMGNQYTRWAIPEVKYSLQVLSFISSWLINRMKKSNCLAIYCSLDVNIFLEEDIIPVVTLRALTRIMHGLPSAGRLPPDVTISESKTTRMNCRHSNMELAQSSFPPCTYTVRKRGLEEDNWTRWKNGWGSTVIQLLQY